MSIYATLWWLKFPRYGDEYIGCEWISKAPRRKPSSGRLMADHVHIMLSVPPPCCSDGRMDS